MKGLLVRHGRRRELAERSASPNRQESSRHYRLGDALVDFDTYEVVKGKRVRRMTPLEIKLLQHLIHSEGRVVSRQELLEEVWEQPGYLQTRAPDQFIRRLRKLFEPVPSDPRHFITVRDAGYRFIADPDQSNETVDAAE